MLRVFYERSGKSFWSARYCTHLVVLNAVIDKLLEYECKMTEEKNNLSEVNRRGIQDLLKLWPEDAKTFARPFY